MSLAPYGETTVQQDGQLNTPTSLNQDGDTATILAGAILPAITGIDSAMVDDHPLAFSVSGLIITWGDAASPPLQRVLVERVLCDYCPQKTTTFLGNVSGSDRTDLVCIAPFNDNANTFTVDFEDSMGGVAPGTGYTVRRGVQYQVLTGGGSPPTGYVAFAHVIVRAMSSTISPSDVTILFETLAEQVAALVGTGSVVTSLGPYGGTALSGDVKLRSTDGSLNFSEPGGDVIDVTVASVANVFRETGTTPNNYGSGTSAQVTLPTDARVYDVMVTFTFYTSHNGSSSISSPSGGGTSGFASVQGSGYNSGTIVATARCVATGAGQTLSFPLACFGGTIFAGIWVCDAVSRP